MSTSAPGYGTPNWEMLGRRLKLEPDAYVEFTIVMSCLPTAFDVVVAAAKAADEAHVMCVTRDIDNLISSITTAPEA
ncbi:MAG: hypothetical protein SGJ13_00115 [Actinomycetota bacterium]|nr:hypothetical protein [Actinomycetota bacterium]